MIMRAATTTIQAVPSGTMYRDDKNVEMTAEKLFPESPIENYLDEEIISLRDLQISNNNSLIGSPDQNPSPQPDIFEFFTNDVVSIYPTNQNFIFCGKSIPFDRSRNFNASSFDTRDHILNMIDKEDLFSRGNKSEYHRSVGARGVSKVNITSLTTMSAKSRRRLFLFGPVKFKPEMELSAIRERQSRRAPGPMFKAVVDDGETVGEEGEMKVAVKGSRVHLGSVLAKSFCIN